MVNFIKFLVTVVIIIVAGLLFIIGVAIAGSSHNVSSGARDFAMNRGVISVIVGIIIIIAIWIPWKRILK